MGPCEEALERLSKASRLHLQRIAPGFSRRKISNSVHAIPIFTAFKAIFVK
jgi:hypothetical protein